jgi:hypothetical protein
VTAKASAKKAPPAVVEIEGTHALYPLTVARVKIRKFVADVGIARAVTTTGIKRATLLALRLGTVADPKCSQILSLEQHAGISLHDWITNVVQDPGRESR